MTTANPAAIMAKIALLLVAGVAAWSATNASASAPAEPPRGQPPTMASLPVEPQPKLDGFAAAWDELRIDKLVRGWSEILKGPPPGELGGPLVGLDWQGYLDFYDGRIVFAHVWSVKEGLGPAYNESACGNCHVAPTLGGGGKDMKDGVRVHGPPETQGDMMALRKYSIPGHPIEQPRGPVGDLKTPPLYGFGLLDAVPDDVISANVDADDKDGNGVRGLRGRRWAGKRSGPTRFGQRASEWNLITYVASALANEVGVTSTLARDPTADEDAVKDPEVPHALVRRIDGYVRNLAPPPRGPITAAVTRGEKIFAGIGCVHCHRPQLGKLQGAYTDLLLHDMGPRLDAGLKDGLATRFHWRTMALWGLRDRPRYLHDERTDSIEKVQEDHLGEAKKISDAYRELPKASRDDLHAFLMSL